MENEKKNFVTGYAIGGPVFLVVFPVLFYFISQKFSYIDAPLVQSQTFQIIISITLLIIGLFFAFWSIIIQRKVGKGGPLEGYKVGLSPKTQKLNTTGPYRFTRNPMLFGTCAFYFSLAVFFNSVIFLLLASVFTIFMNTFVKLTEEKRLLKDFGEEYKIYKSKTAMFIPLPPKNN